MRNRGIVERSKGGKEEGRNGGKKGMRKGGMEERGKEEGRIMRVGRSDREP
jgi:hypothetical protein